MGTNPVCPVCAEILWLERVEDVLLDYVPYPPAAMRDFFERNGPDAMIWECMACGGFWSPAG